MVDFPNQGDSCSQNVREATNLVGSLDGGSDRMTP